MPSFSGDEEEEEKVKEAYVSTVEEERMDGRGRRISMELC